MRAGYKLLGLSALVGVIGCALPVWADESIEHTFTSALRYQHYQPRERAGAGQHDQEWGVQARLNGEHRWRDLQLLWQAGQNRTAGQSETHIELTEFSWNETVSEVDLLRVGKLNLDFDNSNLMKPLGFFQTAAAPFERFASVEGIWQAGWSHFFEDWVVTAVLAEEGQESWRQDDQQWGLALQRDLNSLSFTLMAQQYRGSDLGMGAGFSYVQGVHWSFHGSFFARHGSAYLDELVRVLPENDALNTREGWMPRVTLGAQWSGEKSSLSLEWSYDKRRLNAHEQKSLYQWADGRKSGRAYASMNGPAVATSVAGVLSERHQQHYLYWRYSRSEVESSFSLSGLVGKDGSQMVQISKSWLPTWSFSYWAQLSGYFGGAESELGRAPCRGVASVGLEYVF